MINLDDYISTLLNIINYVQLSISLCRFDNAYTRAYMLKVLKEGVFTIDSAF
jgi:hypothetical protein